MADPLTVRRRRRSSSRECNGFTYAFSWHQPVVGPQMARATIQVHGDRNCFRRSCPGALLQGSLQSGAWVRRRGGWPAVKSMPASLDEYLNSAPELPGAGEAVNH